MIEDEMRFEQFRPRLRPGRMIPQDGRLIYEANEPYDQIILPLQAADFLAECNGQKSVREIVEAVYAKNKTLHFKTLVETLALLYRHGFIVNESEFPETRLPGINTDVNDRQALPLFRLFLAKRIYNDSKSIWIFYLLAMFNIVVAGFSVDWLASNYALSPLAYAESSPIKGWAILLIAFSAMLSAKNFLRGLFLLLLTGRVYNFSLDVRAGLLLYFRVGPDSEQLIESRLFKFLYHLSLILAYFSTAGLLAQILTQPDYRTQILYASLILFFWDLNPFRSSEIKRLLLSLFSSSSRAHNSMILSLIWAPLCLWFLGDLFRQNFRIKMQWSQALSVPDFVLHLLTIAGLLAATVWVFYNAFKLFYFNLIVPWGRKLAQHFPEPQNKNIEKYNENRLLEILSGLPLLNYFHEASLKTLIQNGHLKIYAKNSKVIHKGDLGNELFVLLEGELAVENDSESKNVQFVEIRPISLFGEIAVIEDSQRTANVIAKKSSIVFSTPAEFVRQGASQSEYVRRIQDFKNAIVISQFFTSSRLFRHLTEESKELLIARGKIEFFNANEVVFHQGSFGDSFYIVIRGELEAQISGQKVGQFQQGDFFGEISVIAQVPRTASILSLKSSMLLKIQADTLWEIMAQNLDLALFIESLGEERIHFDTRGLQ